jgi:hypothetical protein
VYRSIVSGECRVGVVMYVPVASAVPPSAKAYRSTPARALGMLFAMCEVSVKDVFHL